MKQFSYRKSRIETTASSRIIALAQVRRLILDEFAGHFVADKTVKAYQLSKQELSVCLSGILIPEIIEERWNGNGTRLRLTVQAETDRKKAINLITLLFRDREKMEELRETEGSINGALKELNNPQKEQSARYAYAVDLLNREGLLERGYALRNVERFEESVEVLSRAILLQQLQRLPRQKGYPGKVTAYAANLRAEPGLESKLLGYVDRGTTLTITGEGKDAYGRDWYRVKPPKGREAWIRADVIRITKQNGRADALSGLGGHSRARAYAARASVYLKDGKPDKAVTDCDQAVTLKPGFARAYNYRGVAYTQLGNYKQAIEDFNRVVRLDSKKVAGYINRGFAYMEMEDFQNAKKDLDYAISMEPANEFAYPNRGRLYAKTGDFSMAIKDYDRALAINPMFTAALLGRGIAYAVSRDYEKAIKDLTAVIELEPKNTDAICSRGSVYLNMGETEKATADYKAAAQLGDADSRNYLKEKGIPWE